MPGHQLDELLFEVTQESDGGYVAECLGEDVFTQGDTWQELRENVLEAVKGFRFDSEPVRQIRLRLVRDEVVSAT